MTAPTRLELRLQPPKPDIYRLPPVVQPNWRLQDLARYADDNIKRRLEEALCARYGVKHCLLLDRARTGLYMLIRAFGLDGEWISTSMMHRPTSVVMKQHCASLAFADVEDDFTIDPSSVSRLYSSHTCAILATHTYGKAADVIRLRDIADRHGLFLVENAVHMAGGQTVGGRPLGCWGDAALLSFNVDKPLGALLGGALLTNRDDVWQAVISYPLGGSNRREAIERVITTYLAYRLKPYLLQLPFFGKHKDATDGVEEIEGFSANSYVRYQPRKIHGLQAAAAFACLTREQEVLALRRRNAERLTEILKDVTDLALPESTSDRPHAYTYYPVVMRKGSRLKLGQILSSSGIETKWRYHPLHFEQGFTECRRDDLSRSEYLWAQHLLVPAGAWTSECQIDYLADCMGMALSAQYKNKAWG